jgi:anti-sigma factor RsiW
MKETRGEWIGQLLDGELDGARSAQAEAHLEECADCRAEMEELCRLSTILSEAPAADGLASPSAFVAQVVGMLDGRERSWFWRRALAFGRRMAPAALVLAWAFLQALWVAAPLVMLAVRAGIGGEALARLVPATRSEPLMQLFDWSAAGLADVGALAASLVQAVGELGWVLALAVAPAAVLAVLFAGWLLAWWRSSDVEGRSA